MSYKDHFSEDIPFFDGDVSKFREWSRQIRVYHAGQKEELQKLTGVRMLQKVKGPLKHALEKAFPDPNVIRDMGIDGLDHVYQWIEKHYGWQAETYMYDKMDQFLRLPSRHISESLRSFFIRHKIALDGFNDVVTEYIQKESGKVHERAMQKYYQEAAQWQAHSKLFSTNKTLYDPPGDFPVPPKKTEPERFALPSVITGFMFLRNLHLTKERRSELIRSAGSHELEQLEEVLRKSEVEVVHDRGHKGKGKSKGRVYYSGEDGHVYAAEPGEFGEEFAVGRDDDRYEETLINHVTPQYPSPGPSGYLADAYGHYGDYEQGTEGAEESWSIDAYAEAIGDPTVYLSAGHADNEELEAF